MDLRNKGKYLWFMVHESRLMVISTLTLTLTVSNTNSRIKRIKSAECLKYH